MKLPPIPSNINDGMYGIHTRKSFIEYMEIINNQVFCLDKPINDKNGKPVFVDGETFRALSLGFFADKNYAYGLTDIQKSHSVTLALTRFSMDIESFETINMEYARDKYNTYYCDGAIKMEGTDYTIVKKDVALGKLNEVKEMSPTDSWQSDFLINKEHVFYRGKILKTADPSSFCAIGGYGFYKDHKTVFRVNGLKIETYPEIDSESFIVIDSSHAIDKHAPFETYWYGAVLSIEHKKYSEFFESNPQLSDYWYFKEKEKLKSTNTALMKNIGGNYFELNNEVYTRIIYDDDRGTVFKRIFNTIASEFKLLDYYYATDGKKLYHCLRHLHSTELKSGSAKVLSNSYVLDGDTLIFNISKKIKIEVETLKIFNDIYACDKAGLIQCGIRKKDVTVDISTRFYGAYFIIDNESTIIVKKEILNMFLTPQR